MTLKLMSLNQDNDPYDTVRCVHDVEIAYQPIVSTTSLRTHGFEALARLPFDSEFPDILALLDAASNQGTLRLVERALLTKSIDKFSQFAGASSARLFCNLDNRIFDDAEVSPQVIVNLAKAAGLQPANVCIELSERQPPNVDALGRMVDLFLKHNLRIAIDDFGQGHSGLNTLMRISPHYVKIDQAFINGLAKSPRQRAIVSMVVGLSHSLGYLVVGEGVEDETDFRALRDLGCDLAQGYLIARPDTHLGSLRDTYGHVVQGEVRIDAIPPKISAMLTTIEPLQLGSSIAKAVDRFKTGSVVDFIPVVDQHHYVHGAIYETDLRYYMFGEYGAALMANKGSNQSLDRLLKACPTVEASAQTDILIDSYVVSGGNKGLVLTLDGRYVGVLCNHAILRLSVEREVAEARDQNPLTFLPGNNSINRHIHDLLTDSHDRCLVFFDFDYFKAFNDTYGFAVGDRALLMFGELLMKFRHRHDAFVGHIGGDDFFASIPANGIQAEQWVRALTQQFCDDVESLYLIEDRIDGGLWAKDRFGETRFFPLLRASAVLMVLPPNRRQFTVADVISTLASGKSQAKKSEDGLALIALPGGLALDGVCI
jgi:EAL domain-containing protein (putative c-di-GMP-specific phosphodiesterase class I)/GGDEF domain-containing protein